MTEASVRSELAAAIRAVNAAFARLPQSVQETVDLATDDIDRELDRALLASDPHRALRAIDSWKSHNLATIRRAGR